MKSLLLKIFLFPILWSKNMKDGFILVLVVFLPLLVFAPSPAKALLIEKTVQRLSGKGDKAF